MPDFMRLLQGFQEETLASHSGTVVGLWPDGRMAFRNRAWFDFARANDGEPAISRDWPLGRSLLEAVPEELQAFYREAFRRCLRDCRPWDHDYECSSATVFRHLHLRAYPLGGGEGLLLVHSLHLERPLREDERPPSPFRPSRHLDGNGFAHQCANCRRVQNLEGASDRWDWVPSLVEHRHEKVSHTICPICLDYYHAA